VRQHSSVCTQLVVRVAHSVANNVQSSNALGIKVNEGLDQRRVCIDMMHWSGYFAENMQQTSQ
jgi:hypothetical protein